MISFQKLWDNYPEDEYNANGKKIHAQPCKTGDKAFYANQCAIRMGVALQKAGIKIKGLRQCPKHTNNSIKHFRSAQQIANWIKKNPVRFGSRERNKRTSNNKISIDDFKSRKGIIFIKNGWGTTDHIDLWDGKSNTMKGGNISYFNKGTEIWFWELN